MADRIREPAFEGTAGLHSTFQQLLRPRGRPGFTDGPLEKGAVVPDVGQCRLASVAAGMRLLVRKPARAAEIVENVERSISRMSGLIDDVLDFARGRLGSGFALQVQSGLPIGAIVAQVVQELQSANPDRQIELVEGEVAALTCDRARIAQLLSNLVGNAVTHGTADGHIRVKATSDGGIFSLSVANTGAYRATGDGAAVSAVLPGHGGASSRRVGPWALHSG